MEDKKNEIIRNRYEPPELDGLSRIVMVTKELEEMGNLTHDKLKEKRKELMRELEKLKRFMNAYYLSFQKNKNGYFDTKPDIIEFDFDEEFTVYENESPMVYYAAIRNTLISFDESYLKKMKQKIDHPQVKKFFEIYDNFRCKLELLLDEARSLCSRTICPLCSQTICSPCS